MRWVLVLVVAAGCLDTGVRCPDGTQCAPGGACAAVDEGYVCGPAAAVAACASLGVADPTGLRCDYAGLAGAGVCVGPVCREVGCGNGYVDDGEFCDDGNTDPVGDDDHCNATCTSDETCGNGVPDYVTGEACDCGDDEASRPSTCAMINSFDPAATCRPDCSAARCGDGLVVAPEQCEGVELGGATCEDVGYYGGTLGCTGACTYDVAACEGTCGDGVVNGPELCDGIAEVSCSEFGFALGRPACTAACGVRFEPCKAGFPASLGDVGGGSYARGLWGPSRQEVYLASVRGLFTFDGSSWRTVEESFNYRGVHGVVDGTRTRVVAVGTNQVQIFDGSDWLELAAGGNAVWVSSATQAWVVGDAITRCDPTARSCAAPVALGAGEHLDAIVGTAGGSVIAVGGRDDAALIMRWDGVSWTETTPPITSALTGVWASAADDITTINLDGQVHRLHDGTWRKLAGTGAASFGLWGTGPDDLFTMSGGPQHFDGATWRQTVVESGSLDFARGHVLATGEVLIPSHPEVTRVHAVAMVPSTPVGLASRAGDELWESAGTTLRRNGVAQSAPAVSRRALEAIPGGGVAFIDLANVLTTIIDGVTRTTPLAGANAALAATGPEDVFVASGTTIGRFADGVLTDLGAPTRSWLALASDGATLYASTSDGELWQRAGASWTEVELPAEAELFLASHLWAAGDVLVVLGARIDAQGNASAVIALRRGTTWQVSFHPNTYGWIAIDGTGPDDIAALGADGVVELYDGLGWLPFASGVLGASDLVLSRSRLSVFSSYDADHTRTRGVSP
ncbi:MAG: hypothetical protein R2939_06345 [Kofleriaceae bacterium]